MNIQGILQQYISNMIAEKVGAKFGLSGQQSQALVAKFLPVLTAALSKNATADKDQASSLYGAIRDDHDGSIFDNIEGLIANPQEAKGSKILQHVLGNKTAAIQHELAQEEGIPEDKVGGMMEMIAPLAMGALGKEQSNQQLGLDDVVGMFTKEKATQKDAGNPLMAILDQNGDGSGVDDLLSAGMKMFK